MNLLKTMEDYVAFRFFAIQIRRDTASGAIDEREARRLSERFEELRGYARLQIALYAVMTASAFKPVPSRFLSWLCNIIATRATVELFAKLDRRVFAQILRSPGLFLLNLMPGFNKTLGISAMLKAEPALYDIGLRYCEHWFEKRRLGFLNRFYARPAIRAYRWVLELEW